MTIYTYWGNKDEETNGTSALELSSGLVPIGHSGDFTDSEYAYFSKEYILEPGNIPWHRIDFPWTTVDTIIHSFVGGGGGGGGAAALPGKPTGVGGTSGNNSVLLAWTAPVDNGGATITGYKIVPFVSGTAQSPILTGSSAPNYNVTGLANGTAYTFEVAAINSVGTGQYSDASGLITPHASAPPQMPIISRGLPVVASQDYGGPYAAANAVDSNYGTFWRSVNIPSVGSPQWIAIDISTISPSRKTNVWAHLLNPSRPSYQPGATTGSSPSSTFSLVAADYVLQKSNAAGGGSAPAVNDASWTNVISPVTDNRRSGVIHTGLDLHDANWFRFYCTRANGVTGSTDDVRLSIDLRDASGGTDDSIIVYGASVQMEAFTENRLDNASWVDATDPGNNNIQELLEASTSRVCPVFVDASTGGWTAASGDTNKADYVGGLPNKYVVIAFGKNDANNANTVWTSVNDTQPQAFKASIQSIIDYLNGLGKIAVLIHEMYGNLNTWTAGNISIINQIIDQLAATNSDPSKCLFMPTTNDSYTFFQNHPALLRDGLHPGYDPSQSGQLYNGKTGYNYYHNLIAQGIKSLIYQL